MKFRRHGERLAISECGEYEIRMAKVNDTPDAKYFYNAWYVPSGKHIEASYDKELVKRACKAHSEKQVTA